jgi:hypothetical protein
MISFKDLNSKYDAPVRMKPAKMTAQIRKKSSKVVYELLKPTWFDSVPMAELIAALKKVDVIVLQEDNTEWAGMLLGNSGTGLFPLGDFSKSDVRGSERIFAPFTNAGLFLSWYHSDSRNGRRIEVIGYIS